jgi:tRNA U55 pseudouridine synthase TruB
MSEKKKTLDYLRKQITLMTLAIDKAEKILEQMKKEQKEYLHSYELAMKTDEKSMEDLKDLKKGD